MKKTITKIIPIGSVLPRRKRVAAYARVSSDKDAMLHSLSAQVSYYSEFIQKNSTWEYVGVYADRALTGTKDNRPEFQRLIQDCKDYKIDMVICKSITRFARNTVDTLVVTRELKDLGIDVFFEQERIHSLSGDGELMLSILASYAQEESRIASENCKWRIRKRFENGELANLRFLYGYDIQKGRIAVSQKQAKVVKYIFNSYINNKNCVEIARTLKSFKTPKMYGSSWTAKDIRRVLKNEKYAGNALLQKSFVKDHLAKKKQKNNGELPKFWCLNTHVPIIDKDTFDLAQERLGQNREKVNVRISTKTKYAFTGKIKCGICGKNFKRKIARGRHFWHCSTFLEFGKVRCQAKQIPEHILKLKVIEVLQLSIFQEDRFKIEIKQILVPEQGTIIFCLKNGKEIKTTWQNRSRSESWTAEMKQNARERNLCKQQK